MVFKTFVRYGDQSRSRLHQQKLRTRVIRADNVTRDCALPSDTCPRATRRHTFYGSAVLSVPLIALACNSSVRPNGMILPSIFYRFHPSRTPGATDIRAIARARQNSRAYPGNGPRRGKTNRPSAKRESPQRPIPNGADTDRGENRSPQCPPSESESFRSTTVNVDYVASDRCPQPADYRVREI